MFAGTDCAGLNSAAFSVFGTENIRILVGRASDLSLERLLRKVVVTLIGQTLGLLVVGLVMENVTLCGIVLTSATIVVDDVLVGVTEDVRAILSLL